MPVGVHVSVRAFVRARVRARVRDHVRARACVRECARAYVCARWVAPAPAKNQHGSPCHGSCRNPRLSPPRLWDLITCKPY
eukprot:11746762-Alexandrium_andersonii.AAC.1